MITRQDREAAEEIFEKLGIEIMPMFGPDAEDIAAAIIARYARDGELRDALRGAIALIDSEYYKGMMNLAVAHGLNYSGPILFNVEAARALLAAQASEEGGKGD